jgi:hypothetical protein
MIRTMAAGGNALADDLNKFNRVMNLGHELAKRFTGAFGSTQCRARQLLEGYWRNRRLNGKRRLQSVSRFAPVDSRAR